MPELPSLLIIQWGIVGFYVAIYFILGFLRGGTKSTYFTIVAFITTFISLYLISFISLNLVLSSSFTLVNLLEMINGYAGGIIPAQVFEFAADATLAAFAIAVVDLILRIVGFILIYPMIKGLLTLIIFRPIWSFGIKKALIRHQNDKMYEKAMDEGIKDYKPRKRYKKNFFGRFFGGFMGAAQGLLVAFIILLPLLIMASFLTVEATGAQVQNDENQAELAVGLPDLGGLQTMLDDYLLQIDELNAQGLGAIVRQITVSGIPLDRYIFDRVFTTEVKEGEVVTPINWINELQGLLTISRTIYDGGYIGGEFGLEDIDQDMLDDIDVIFNYLETSDLISYMIPTATAFGLETFRDSLLAGITDELADQAVLAVQEIDWKNEFTNVQAIVDAILTFGSYEEFQAYMADPNLLLDLTPEQGVELANIIRAMGNMQLLELIPVAVEYATTLDQLQSQLSWIDEAERQAYLEEQLAFLTDNPEFFNGVDGEFARLALLIEGIYTDEFGDVNLRQLISTSDPEAFLDAQNEEWIDNLLEKIVDLEILMNTIPVGVDFALYTQVGDLVDEELAGDIEAALNDVSWDEEILNIGDIYKEAVQIGAATLLQDNPNYILFVDDVMTNNMDKVRLIVEKIFEDSALVSAALELASPILVERFVTNPEVAAIVNEALISDPVSGEVDFNVGQEINTLLDIIEKIYLFSSAEELTNFGGLTTESKFDLFAGFGTLTETQFEELKTSFESLQLLNRVSESALIYARDSMGIEQIYVPSEVNLGSDIGSILGLAYYVAQYTSEHKALYPTYEEIDFAPLFADETFRSYLLPTAENNHSTLLLANMAHNAKYYSNDPSLSSYLKVPQTLLDASPESVEWNTELQALLGAVFDLAASFEDSTVLTLSYQDVIAFKNAPTSASIELITQFADPVKADATFGSLDSSSILRSSLKQAIDTLGGSVGDSLGGYALITPAIAVDGDMLKENMLVELINGLAILVEDLNTTWQYETVAELTGNLGVDAIIPAFNNLEDSSLLSFTNITLIKGVISEALLSTEIKSFGIEKLNGAQTFFTAPADFLDLDPLLLDAEGVKGDEIGKLLISIKSLQLPDQAALSSFGPQMLNAMVGRNLSAGMDDLDRFFDSGILYTFLDKALQLDGINDFVNDMLSTAFEGAAVTIDLSPHPSILGNAVDDEPIEVDRITKDEFRNMVISAALLGPLDAIGIETFPRMIDPLATEDDFTTFLGSDYIYTVVGRLFENQGFGDYIGGFLAGAFGDGITLDMTSPSDAKGTTGVEEGIITKEELRYIMVSFKLLGLENGTEGINEERILNLVGTNDVAGVDDFDRFIQSKYIADKLSIVLTSETVIELIAAGRFLPSEFEILPSAYTIVDGRKRLTNIEFSNIFSGLFTLGLRDFEDTSQLINNLKNLEDNDVDQVLESYFLYEFIDLMLKSETAITIPSQALETSGEFIGMVKKSEISDIFTAFSIFELGEGETPNPEDITVDQIIQLIDETDSSIVQSLLSDAIIQALGAENIPADALESEGLLEQDEIDAIVAVLDIIQGDGPTLPITGLADKIEEITIEQANEIDLTETGSATIKQMISDRILNTLNPTVIPDGALNPLSASNVTLLSMQLDDEPTVLTRLTDFELQQIILAINILSPDTSTPIISIPTNPTVGQTRDLQSITSLIIRQFMTDKISSVLSSQVSFPTSAFDETHTTILSITEVSNLLDAIAVLAYDNPTNEIDYNVNDEPVQDVRTTLYVKDAVALKTTDSYIIRQLITDKIEGILETELTFPDAAYDSVHTTMLTKAEIGHMIDALVILAYDNSEDDPEYDPDYDVNEEPIADINPQVNVGKAVSLKTTDSYIIRQLITDKIEVILETELTFPDVAYDSVHTTMLTKAEIGHMIDALVILAYDNPTDDPDYDVNEESIADINPQVNVGKAVSLKTTDSYIIRQLITDKIEGILETELTFPDVAYDSVHTTMLSKIEIGHMIDALVILAYDNPTDDPDYDVNEESITDINSNVNVGKARGLKNNESYIVRQLVTDNIETALSSTVVFPSNAYDPVHTTMLLHDEIKEIIDALYIMSDENDDLPVTSVPTSVTVGQTTDLKDNESLIINQLVSDKIIESLTVSGRTIPVTAYTDPVAKVILKDTEIDAMIDALSVLSGGDDDMLVTNIPTDVTIGQLKSLSVSTSMIIQRLITDSIVDAVNLTYFPDEAYVGDTPGDQLKTLEISNMIAALEVLAGSTTPGDVDGVKVTAVSTNPTVGQTQDLKTNDSLIINQLISESIISTLSGQTIPDSAYVNAVTKESLTNAEIDHMIDALLILADGNEAMLVSAVPTDVTIGQLKGLSASSSIIIQRLITDSIHDAVNLTYFPDEAYVGDTPSDQLKTLEISNMILALEVLAGSTVPGDKDATKVSAISTNVTVGQTQSLKTNDSLIINQLISESIVDTLTLAGSTIPDDAYVNATTKESLTNAEIDHMIDALLILADGNTALPVASISTNVDVGQTQDLKANSSVIIRQLISDAIVDSVGLTATIPDAAYIDPVGKERLTDTEINHMIDALLILADGDLDLPVSSISTDITIGQLDDLTENDSIIMQKLITDSIVDAVTVDKVPDDAYILDTPGNNLKETEVGAMVDALRILADDPLDPNDVPDDKKVSSISTNVTVGQAKDLKLNGSVIIKQIISDAIVTMLTAPKIRETAYIDPVEKDRLANDEIGYMIDALDVLSGGNDALAVSAITVNENTLSISSLKQFNANSIILNRLISNAMIDGLGAAEIPVESYEDSVAKTDLIRPEIDAILDALDTLGIGTSGAGGIGMADLTFADLDTVVAIGTTDLVKYPLGFSPIVAHILSDPMIAAVTDVRGGYEYGVPSTAYRNTYDLLHDEIEGLVAALKLIGNIGTEPGQLSPVETDVSEVVVDPDAFDGDMILDLIAIDGLIVYRLISKGINEADIDTIPSHVTDSGARNYDAALLAVLPAPEIYDIKITEMSHIAVSMNELGIGSIGSVMTDITVEKLQDPETDIELLIEATVIPESNANTIIYYIISETVDPTNTLFDSLVPVPYPGTADDYYVIDGSRLRLKRTSIAAALVFA
jgi:hypothetical protein